MWPLSGAAKCIPSAWLMATSVACISVVGAVSALGDPRIELTQVLPICFSDVRSIHRLRVHRARAALLWLPPSFVSLSCIELPETTRSEISGVKGARISPWAVLRTRELSGPCFRLSLFGTAAAPKNTLQYRKQGKDKRRA